MALHFRINSGLLRTILGLSCFAFFITVFPACSASDGGEIANFSADMVMMGSDGTVKSTSKIYVTPNAHRLDGMPGPMPKGMAGDLTFIRLNDENKEYVYNHDKKLFFEDTIDKDSMMDIIKLYDNADAEEVLGNEKVSGYDCVKKKVTTTTNVMGMKIKNTRIIWQSDRFKMPLKVQGEEGNITEYRNISTKKPSNSLFKPLSGYKKVDNMMTVMGMRMK